MDYLLRFLSWEKKKYSDKFDVILLTDDDQLYVSEGIADDFQSDYKVNIMKK